MYPVLATTDELIDSASPDPRENLARLAVHLHLTFGWALIPCKLKIPTVKYERFKRRNMFTPDLIRRHFHVSREPDGFVALLGHRSNGLAARDFDTEEGYHLWSAAHPELAARLPTFRTSRGFQALFVLPDGKWPRSCPSPWLPFRRWLERW